MQIERKKNKNKPSPLSFFFLKMIGEEDLETGSKNSHLYKCLPEGLSKFIPSNYEISSIFSSSFMPLIFYGPFAVFIFLWFLNTPSMPINLKRSVILQLRDMTVQGEVDTFVINKGLAGSPIPSEVIKLSKPLLPHGLNPRCLNDILITGSADICIEDQSGAVLIPMKETTLITLSSDTTNSPIGLSFGGTAGHPFITDLGMVIVVSSWVALLLSALYPVMIYHIIRPRKDL